MKYRAHKRDYFQIQTFAGSLVFRVAMETENGPFDRAVIFKFNDGDRFQIKPPGIRAESLRRASLRKLGTKR